MAGTHERRRWLVRWASRHCRQFGEKPRRRVAGLGTVAHRATLSRVSFIGAEATGVACSKPIRNQIARLVLFMRISLTCSLLVHRPASSCQFPTLWSDRLPTHEPLKRFGEQMSLIDGVIVSSRDPKKL
jgi:hypothetical protein